MRVDALAIAAVEEIRSGMIVGLGTGRAATRGIEALARRIALEHMRVVCVATSRASETLGRELCLDVQPIESIAHVDHLFDGADEVDPLLRMIKGRGGAMTRERVVAHAARRRIYLVQTTKLVSRLGEIAPLPIEVEKASLPSVQRVLRDLGLDGIVRKRDGGGGAVREYETDGGNPVIDARLPAHLDLDLDVLAATLDATPGVIGHGLFLNEADLVWIEDDQGRVSSRARSIG